MKTTLAAVGLISVLTLLGGAAWKTFANPDTAPAVRGPMGTTVADLPVSRHSSVVLSLPDNQPAIVPFPSAVGFLITEIAASIPGDSLTRGTIRIDGAITAEWTGNKSFNPPILVPPSSTLEFTPDFSQISVGIIRSVMISGYFIFPTDLL